MVPRTLNSKLLLVAVLLLCTLLLKGQDDRKYIRQGNRKYSAGKFPESEVLYRRALNNNKTSSDAGFNVGDALYMQNKFDEAARQFQGSAGVMTDIVKKADSYYNMGNSYIKAGKFEEAVAAFKNSLKLVPGNNQAKFNLAYAQDKLSEQQKDSNKDKKEPSEYARKLKAQADIMVAEGRFGEAFALMQEGMKKDETVSYYNDFIQKTGKVAQIESRLK